MAGDGKCDGVVVDSCGESLVANPTQGSGGGLMRVSVLVLHRAILGVTTKVAAQGVEPANRFAKQKTFCTIPTQSVE